MFSLNNDKKEFVYLGLIVNLALYFEYNDSAGANKRL